MKDWLFSQQIMIIFAVIELLFFIAYVFLVAIYFLGEWVSGLFPRTLMAVLVVMIVAIFIWGLLSVNQGEKKGLTILMVASVFPLAISLYDIVLYSPITYGWPVVQIVLYLTFFFSAIALGLVLVQIRG